MHNILREIVQAKHVTVERQKRLVPLKTIRQHIDAVHPARSLQAALTPAGINIIAEIKFASPSKGCICANHDPEAFARDYTDAGAAAISVLTEEDYFKGSLAYMSRAKASTGVPVLRKDFIIDEYQIYESRAHGADAVLLITALHTAESLARYIATAASLCMECLVEVHNEDEVATAVKAGARIIGINNRDMTTFTVDLACAERLAPHIPAGIITVVESGISGTEDVRRFVRQGLHNFLIGETLARSNDRKSVIREFLEVSNDKS